MPVIPTETCMVQYGMHMSKMVPCIESALICTCFLLKMIGVIALHALFSGGYPGGIRNQVIEFYELFTGFFGYNPPLLTYVCWNCMQNRACDTLLQFTN